MARVYLETSFISACVTTRTDAGSVHRRATSLEWMRDQAHRHELFVSAEVVSELSAPSYPGRDTALKMIGSFPSISVDPDVRGMANVLVRERVMPGPVSGDAIHVAACIIYQVEYLLSWNVRHLANPNKIAHLRVVCLRLGHVPPLIVTPDLLWETST